MNIKTLIFKNIGVQATYQLNSDGSVYLSSIVTQGNFVQEYNNKYFSSISELEAWVRQMYG